MLRPVTRLHRAGPVALAERSGSTTPRHAGGRDPRTGGTPYRRSTQRWCYVFVLPSLVLAVMFTFWPIAASWYYSLQDWSGFAGTQTFIGLGNYREIVHDKYFWHAFKVSFLFMIVTVPIRMLLGFAVAVVLNDRALRMSKIFRTLFFIPVVTTTAIVGLLMTFVLSPTNGPVNQVLLDLHVISGPINFLGGPSTALPTLMAVFVWKFFGIVMVYWLAALQAVPSELYEAARVDGASRWRTHVHITWPLLLPFAVIIMVITAVNTLRIFDLVQTMTGGGPFFATEVMEVYIYRNAFAPLGGGVPRLGYASAAGVFFGVTVMCIALAQGWITQRFREFRRDLRAQQ